MRIKLFFGAMKSVINRPLLSLLNLLSLIVGLCAFFFLTNYVINQKAYDKHIADYKQIYRVHTTPRVENIQPWARSLGFIKNACGKITEVEEVTRFTFCQEGSIEVDRKQYQQKGILSVDKEFFDLMGVQCVSGSPEQIDQPNTAFVTESFANKFFDGKDAIGKQIEVKSLQYLTDVGSFEIVGVVKDPHPRFHIKYQVLISQKGALDERFEYLDTRKIQWVYHYVKLHKGSDTVRVAGKIDDAFQNHELKKVRGPEEYDFSLFPLASIHLNNTFRFAIEEDKESSSMFLLLGIALAILLVTILNHTSLSLSGFIKRTKEFSIKNALGAKKSQIVFQLLIETSILLLISGIASLLIIEVSKPFVSDVFGLQYQFFVNEFQSYIPFLGVLILAFIINAIFFMFFINRYFRKSQQGENSTFFNNQKRMKYLVFVQLITIICILSMGLLVYNQVQYLLQKEKGYSCENVLVIQQKTQHPSTSQFIQELQNRPQIVSVGSSQQYFGYPMQSFSLNAFGQDGSANMIFARMPFLRTMGLDFRIVNQELLSDTVTGFVFNQQLYDKMIRTYGSFEAFEVEWVKQFDQARRNDSRIIGVVKDFNYESGHHQIGDLMIYLSNQPRDRFIHVKLRSQSALSEVKELYATFFPDKEMDYFFLENKIQQQYKSENKLRKIFMAFAIIGLVLVSSGLIALARFNAQMRTKEIGIRKVNGASIAGVLWHINKQIIYWVIAAVVVSVPVVYYFGSAWLSSFAYRIDLPVWVVGLSGIFVLLIVAITISWQSLSAASRNPVKALRYE